MIRHTLRAALLLSLCAGTLSAQSTDYTILIPVYTDEGAYLGDYDLARAVVTAGGEVTQGGGYPQILSQLGVREYSPVAVSDGSGGMILVYTIEHVDSTNLGDTDILLRRIDAGGADVWNDSITGSVRFLADSPNLERNPVAIPISDGILIIYEIEYTSGDFLGDVDIAARFIRGADHSRTDEALWVASSDRREENPQLVRSDGATLVIFERSSDRERGSTGDIVAVRVADDGTKGWPGGAPEIPVGSSPHGETNAAVVSDGRGGFYAAYELWYSSGDRSGDVDIIAQHVDRSGLRQWVDAERPPVVASSRKAFEKNPTLTVDSFGVVVAFEIVETSGATGANPNSAIGLQRLDSSGQGIWNRGSRSVIVQAKHRTGILPQILPDGQGGTYVFFDGFDSITGDRDVFAQHVGADGMQSWNREQAIPVFFGPMPEVLIDALPDNRGGVVVFAAQLPVYRTESTYPRDTAVIAHRLDRLGEHTWGIGENNLLVTQTLLGEHQPVIVVLGN